MTRRTSGVAIIVVLLSISLLAVVALGVATMSSQNLMHAHSEHESLSALYAAEGGAWRKAAEIVGMNPAPIPVTTMPNTEATYQVEVTPGGGTASNGFGVPNQPDVYYLLATGRSVTGYRRQVGLLVQRTESVFLAAAFADDWIDIKDGHTDTFDTSLPGIYPMNKVDGAGLAHVGVNASSLGAIKFSGDDATVNLDWKSAASVPTGNVLGGPGSDESIVADSTTLGNTYASFQPMMSARPLPPVTIPAGHTPGTTSTTVTAVVALLPGDYGDYTIDGGNLVLAQAGVYVFKRLTMQNGARLRVPPSADVEVYLAEGFEILSGSIVNQTARPEKLQFKVVTGAVNLKDEGTEAYYVLYAPDSDVVVQNAEIFGSVVGKTLKLDGDAGAGFPAIVHYDRQLTTSTSTPGATTLNILSLQRF